MPCKGVDLACSGSNAASEIIINQVVSAVTFTNQGRESSSGC